MFFAETIGNIVGDTQRIEKCTLLKHKSDLPAESKQFPLRHAAQIVPEHAHCARIGFYQPHGQLQGERLSRSTLTNEHFCFARCNRKRKALQHVALVETNAYIFKGKNRFARQGPSSSSNETPIIIATLRRAHSKDYRWKRSVRGSRLFNGLKHITCEE